MATFLAHASQPNYFSIISTKTAQEIARNIAAATPLRYLDFEKETLRQQLMQQRNEKMKETEQIAKELTTLSQRFTTFETQQKICLQKYQAFRDGIVAGQHKGKQFVNIQQQAQKLIDRIATFEKGNDLLSAKLIKLQKRQELNAQELQFIQQELDLLPNS